jgi:transposase
MGPRKVLTAAHNVDYRSAPGAGVVDSQSVKADATVTHVSRGFDAGKKINGRKRHLLTDTLGLLLAVLVTPASTTDRDAARILLPTAKNHFRRLARVWADGGYTGHLTDWTTQYVGLVLDIVRRSDDVQGFQVLPRRWVVERSFAWLLRSRRLVRDYERRTDTSESVILWSMTTLMSRRLAARRQQRLAPARAA